MKNEEILEMNNRKKFSAIIQNPPYANKLHEKFLIKCLDISERGVSIQPAVWINKANKNRKSFKNIIDKCNGRMKEINIISHREMNNYFGTGNSLQEGGIFYWDVKGDLDLNNFGYTNELEKSLFEKTNIDSNEEMQLLRKGGHKYVNGKEYEVKDNEVPVYQWHGGDNCYDAVVVPKELWKKKATLLLTFDTKEEADNFRTSLKTKFADWFFYNYVVPGDYKILTYMYRMKDYTKPWTDERYYKTFNLTKDEIKIIEEYIDKIEADICVKVKEEEKNKKRKRKN